jgi:hypothetical protein
MFKNKTVLTKSAPILATLVFVSVGMAEERYGGEMTGYAGMQHFPGVTNALLGGAIGTPIGQKSQFFMETGYVPMGSGDKLVNFAAGFTVGLPSRSDSWTPYLTFLGGLGRQMGNGSGENDATYGAGVGVRYFFGPRWGVRPEIRWQRYQGTSGGVNSYVFSTGVFYRFGGK